MDNQNNQATYAPVSPDTIAQPNNGAAPQKKTAAELKKERDQRISTQNHLLFREIRDNMVLMRDGSLRMVIRASAINFDLMSPGEQDAVEYAYQGFLNSLHFPIQIAIRSRKIDLNPYLEKLEGLQANQENQLLAGLMEDYIFNVRGLLDEVNIMNKEFYVVVPFFISTISKDNLSSKLGKLFKPSEDVIQSKADYEKNKKDLLQRTSTVAQGLAQMGIRVAILSTQELIELYYSAYNLEESQVQTLTDTSHMTTPFVSREGGPVQPPAAPVAPIGSLPHDQLPDDMYSAAARRSAGLPSQQAYVAPQPNPAIAPVPQSYEVSSAPPMQTPAPPPAPDQAQVPAVEQVSTVPTNLTMPPAQSATESMPLPPNPMLQNSPEQASATPPNPLEVQFGNTPPTYPPPGQNGGGV